MIILFIIYGIYYRTVDIKLFMHCEVLEQIYSVTYTTLNFKGDNPLLLVSYGNDSYWFDYSRLELLEQTIGAALGFETTSQNITTAELIDSWCRLERSVNMIQKELDSQTYPAPPQMTLWCDMCLWHNFIYLLFPDDVCGNQADSQLKLDMLVTVLSHPAQFIERAALRQTWLSQTLNNTSTKVRHVFLMGSTDNNSIQADVVKEHSLHGDIVQQNFVDSYENLTYKTLLGLEFSTKYCANAKFIFKIDSDLYANLTHIINLTKSDQADQYIHGICVSDGSDLPWRVHGRKYSVSQSEYPFDQYPPYCKGPRYIVPTQVARAILEQSINTPFFKLEDVYIGMCLSKTKYTVNRIEGIDTSAQFVVLVSTCDQLNVVVTSHGFTPELLLLVWKLCFP